MYEKLKVMKIYNKKYVHKIPPSSPRKFIENVEKITELTREYWNRTRNVNENVKKKRDVTP